MQPSPQTLSSVQLPPKKEEIITFDELFSEIAVRVPTVENLENREIILSVSQKVQGVIKAQESAYTFFAANSPKAMVKQYCTFFDSMMHDSSLIDSTEFCFRVKTRAKNLESSTLASAIKSEVDRLLGLNGKRYAEKVEQNRFRRIEQRETITVSAVTLFAYGIFFNVVSSLVPRVETQVPSNVFFTLLIGVMANLLTTGYQNDQEVWGSIQRISDRVVNNVKLGSVYTSMYNLVEGSAVVLSNQVNRMIQAQQQGGQGMIEGLSAQPALPPSNVKITPLN